MHSKSASLSEPSSICTMGETFYLYSLAWWHCIGIKKHVLCNSSDNIILSKDIPKTPPKPSFRITLTCYSWTLWWISMTFAFLVLRSPRCEDLITLSQHHSLLCLTFFFLNEKSYITQLSIVTCCKNWSPGVFFVRKNNWFVHTVAQLIFTARIPYLVGGSSLRSPFFFLIMLIYALFLFSTREFLLRDMLGSGVISNDWQCYDENEDLLCTIGTYWYRVSLHQFSLSLFCREIHISTPNLLSLYSTLWRR